MLSARENYIRTVRRTGPEWIPISIHIQEALWAQSGHELENVLARHPILFPDFKPGRRDFKTWKPNRSAGDSERDPWGVLWRFDYPGLEGQAVEHPLLDWAALQRFSTPDPTRFSDRGTYDWPKWHDDIRRRKQHGGLSVAALPHGFFLMRLWYLRGFENLMLDVAADEPRLRSLCDLLLRRNAAIVQQFIGAAVDVVHFPEDIGTQTASILSPRDFRKWVAPAYKSLMQPVRQAGIIVDTHTDGYVLELVDDLLDCGCDVLNPQDLCNGIDNIARTMKGRCCVNLDIDRQKIVPFGTPNDIRDLIEEEVRKLGTPEGGLALVCGLYPPTPPENVHALLAALEEFRTCWWQ